jgi:hypothetical protein
MMGGKLSNPEKLNSFGFKQFVTALLSPEWYAAIAGSYACKNIMKKQFWHFTGHRSGLAKRRFCLFLACLTVSTLKT